MAWYVGKDGHQVWIQKDESVYTVIQPEDKLPTEDLSYLVKTSTKAVFQEHLMEEHPLDSRTNSRRQRTKMAGRQRGFIVRVHQEEQLHVVPWFKAAAVKLMNCAVVSRVDTEEAVNAKQKKKKDQNVTRVMLGVNECRVETTSRIHHFAHGPGFRVEVAEGSVQQRIHFFTSKRELQGKDWHKFLVAALESTGAHVMLARRTAQDAEQQVQDGAEQVDEQRVRAGSIEEIGTLRKNEAAKDEDAWFASMMKGFQDDDDSSEDDSAEEEEADPTTNGAPPRDAEASNHSDPQVRNRGTPVTQVASTSASEVPEWRRRDNRDADPSVRKGDAPTVSKKDAGSRPKAKESAGRQQPPKQQPPKQQPPKQQPQQQAARPTGWWQVREEQQQAPARQPPEPHQEPQWTWWKGQWYEQPSWQSESAPAKQAAWGAEQWSVPVQDLFAKTKQDEKGLSSMGQELKEMLNNNDNKCGECGRGRPLKLFVDPDDDQWYCRLCWIEFYGLEPPGK